MVALWLDFYDLEGLKRLEVYFVEDLEFHAKRLVLILGT